MRVHLAGRERVGKRVRFAGKDNEQRRVCLSDKCLAGYVIMTYLGAMKAHQFPNSDNNTKVCAAAWACVPCPVIDGCVTAAPKHRSVSILWTDRPISMKRIYIRSKLGAVHGT